MTHANDIATLTALRDEQDILDVWRSGNDLVQCETEPSRTPEQIAALDSAITALAASEAKVKALAEALQSLRKDAYIGATTGVVGCGEMIATIDAAMKEVGHE